MIHQLVDKFSLDNYSLVAITGGGGKTSLMYTLGNYFSCWEKVLATTTTHIRPPEAGACGAFFTGSIADCEAAAAKQQGPVLYAAARGYDGVKLAGYKQNEVDALSADGAFDRIFVEADGSQGLSFKVYEEWEPPVPASSSCQIVVAGADVLLSEASPLTIFRFYLLNKRYQIAKGENCPA
jgi:probable selenium-dependent hydroxylase accessory protein YqeC